MSIDLKVWAKAIKVLKENMGVYLCYFRLISGFLYMKLKEQAKKEKNKLLWVQNLKKNFCADNVIMKKVTTQRTGETICKSYIW